MTFSASLLLFIRLIFDYMRRIIGFSLANGSVSMSSNFKFNTIGQWSIPKNRYVLRMYNLNFETAAAELQFRVIGFGLQQQSNYWEYRQIVRWR